MKKVFALLAVLPLVLFGDEIPALFPTNGVLVSEGTNGNVVATNDLSGYVSGFVPETRKINGQPLTNDITVAGVATNDVSTLVARDDDTDAWIVGRNVTSMGSDAANSVAMTNTAVRWNEDLGYWQMKLEGTRYGESVDGWYAGAVFDGDPANVDDNKYLTPGRSGPFEVTNSNPRATIVTLCKSDFSGNDSHALYAVRKSEPIVAGLLDLASKSDIVSSEEINTMVTNSVTQKVNTYKDLHYDVTLEVTWTNVYDNGHVYMVTVTNTNVSVAQ